jgi:hypothetical protein
MDQNDIADEARQRTANLAVGMTKLMAPITVASIFAGAAVTLLRVAYGADMAREFFEEIAKDIATEQERLN